MELFESYDRRIDKILGVLKEYGIGSVEECRDICAAAGLDPYKIVKDVQPIAFENAGWAYTVGAAIAIKTNARTAVEAAKANDYEVIIIADHGNADHALNEDGTPNTAHSLNPVPFVYVSANKDAKVENGVLADVAPSILHIMGMPQPAEMSGKDLIK